MGKKGADPALRRLGGGRAASPAVSAAVEAAAAPVAAEDDAPTAHPATSPAAPEDAASAIAAMQEDAAADSATPQNATTFAAFGLDARLTRALAKAKLVTPTHVQARAIPVALQGRDLLCRARTGSGKTAAYTLPMLQKIIAAKEANPALKGVQGLILVPTRELCEQVRDHLRVLSFYCARLISTLMLTADVPMETQRTQLAQLPDIVVSTPARLLAHLDAKNLNIATTLETLVVDEADLVLSFGYEDDLRRLLPHLPKVVQTFLMSATLSSDVDQLQRLLLHEPALLQLEDTVADAGKLKQYFVRCPETDKFLLLYFVLKMKLIAGKAIIFVNSIERCYRVKLFLEQFTLNTCVLNAELPQNTRYHIVQEFNRGVYDYIVATDDANRIQGARPSASASSSAAVPLGELDGLPASAQPGTDDDEATAPAVAPPASVPESKRKQKGRARDAEFGVSRGIDFQDVAVVFNFDFPLTVDSYTHRVGRTARGGKHGTAISFVTIADTEQFDRVRLAVRPPGADAAATTLETSVLQPFKFKMEDVNNFRYRVEDALRSVTRSAIREARLKELKTEILFSEKLKAHFEDHPQDLAALRHDKALLVARVKPHLKHLPAYLLPGVGGRGASSAGLAPTALVDSDGKAKHVPFRVQSSRPHRGSHNKKKGDPLRSFSYSKAGKPGSK